MRRYELAELNIARLRAPIDSEEIRPFAEAIDRINALGESWPGFVWRQRSDDGDYPIGQRRFGGEEYIFTLTVWESIEALRAFVLESEHLRYLRRRREWFHHMAEASTVLWWIDAGHRPDSREADARLRRLREHGPTADAFDLRHPFVPPLAEPTATL